MIDPRPTVGRCGDHAPTVPGVAAAGATVCALPHGHAGWHRDDHGAEWSHGEPSAIADISTAVALIEGIAKAHRAATTAGGERFLAALREYGGDVDVVAAARHAQDLSRQAAAAWHEAAVAVGSARASANTGTVTMPAEVAMFLTAGHLDHLHAAGQDLGCCPVCCGPCKALKQLLDAGQLDDIVRPYAQGGWECWDEQTGQVDRVWLADAWRMTDCHNPEATR